MKTVIVFLADGFEECEGLLVVDLLRRAEVNVITASVMGRTEIESSHGISIKADVKVEEVDFSLVDMIVLPGGLPGIIYLGENEIVKKQCLSFVKDKYIAAICAAPSILASLGLLEGKSATCHPAFEEKMAGAIITKEPISIDGNIITGQGLGSSILFALKIVETLLTPEIAREIAEKIKYLG